MNSRDLILHAIKQHPLTPTEHPKIPNFVPSYDGEMQQQFKEQLAQMGGKWLDYDPQQDLAQIITQLYPQAKQICSATTELPQFTPISQFTDPRQLETLDVGIVRAAFAVAETGSICLTEKELGLNALGFLPQFLIALLDPAQIVPTIHDAYHHPEFRNAKYTVLMTGPSATADIEGVMIRGAQGVRALTVIPVANPQTETEAN